jgi:hypothetical protein
VIVFIRPVYWDGKNLAIVAHILKCKKPCPLKNSTGRAFDK